MKVSEKYWEARYRAGRTSGANSEGQAAIDKAMHIDKVIYDEDVTSIIDWGVGDGTTLSHIAHEIDYIGVDVSKEIIRRTRDKFAGREKFQFVLDDEAVQRGLRAEMALSCDVLFHLVDDVEYELYLRRLFDSADRLVLICSYNDEVGKTARHIHRRPWTPDVARWFPDWRLTKDGQDPTRQDFYTYRRR